MMLTYCKLCFKDVILSKTNTIPEDNKDPNGYIVCKKCYWFNYSQQKKLQDKREETIGKVLKKKWYKFWIR